MEYRTVSLADQVFERLENDILSGKYQRGEIITELQLCSELGVSRTPVREALMDLAKFHIVEVLPQRGSRIALIDYALVEEARFARQVLEVAILEQVCEQATADDLSRLRRNVRFQELTQEPNMAGSLSLMELDDDFHGMLFHIAQKDNICQMLSGMTIHFDRVRTLALNIVRDSKIISDHREICDAIAMKDVQRARDVMRKHLSRVKVDEEAIRKACPQYIRD